MATAPERKPSVIMALHSRYEAAFAEYQAVERAEMMGRRQGATDDRETAVMHYRDAEKTLDLETDAIRNAILFQVPETWTEEMVLQYHIYCAHDLYANADKPDDGDIERLGLAIDTLFDFMCCSVNVAHEEIGLTFKDAAERVLMKRRLRTGVVEG